MTFDQVWGSVSIGEALAVSDGRAEPSPDTQRRWNIWRSHNFSGPLIAKIDGAPRKLRIQARADAGVTVAYDVAEDVEHNFEMVSP